MIAGLLTCLENVKQGGQRMQEPFEIERKFLIEYPDTAWLERQPGCQRAQITQTYLLADAGEEARVRMKRQGDAVEYVHTIKRRVTDIRRVEIERQITCEEYEQLLAQADPVCRVMEKVRYCLPHMGQRFEIDVYPFWDDQAIMEIELGDEDEQVHFPPQIRVIREVTREKGFKNAELARRG